MVDDAPATPTAETGPAVAQLRVRRDELATDGPPPGRAWCHAWTDAVDELVRTLWVWTPDRDAVTVVAVGGYGRRELCPASDVDLLIVHDDLDEAALGELTRDLFHPLWDAGCKLGNAVRTPAQVFSDAFDELDTATAVLDGRVVAGDPARFETPLARILQRLDDRPRKFLTQLGDADAARRFKAGDAAEQLEPDIKSGAGGLRDVQSLRWAAAAVVGRVGIEGLVDAGHLGHTDVERLHAAEDELLALRVALHLTSGSAADVLRFEHQQGVAELVGEVDGATDLDTAAHRALTRHYLAARTVEHVHDRAWRQLRADASRPFLRRRGSFDHIAGLDVIDGAVRIPDAEDLTDPAFTARLLEALAADANVLDRTAAARLRAVAPEVEAPDVWPEALCVAFERVLRDPEAVVRVTAELDDVGWLVALIPEWERLRGRPQRNPFHRYALDRHGVHAAEALGRLVDAEEWATAALVEVEDRAVLWWAALLHDVGKAWGEPHSETGVPVARAIAGRFGLVEERLDLLETLIRHHLLLPDVGTRRDVADPAEAKAVAEQVGDRSTLASLWLLTAADGLATGASAWTSWKASLVSLLIAKVRAVLDERDPADLADGADATTAAAVDLAPDLGVDPDTVRAHLLQLPERYAAAVSARAVVRHARMAADPLGPNEVRTRVTSGEKLEDGVVFDELDVVARDTPGLFAKVAGVVSLHGGDILEAHAHTREDGTAVDTFTVVPPEHATGSWWVSVEGDLVEAVAGRLAVRARVARKQASEQRRLDRLPDVRTTVSSGPDAAGRATLVEVHTLDRVGVLYRIAAALAELQLDLVVAKVTTLGHEAVDVFTVRDGAGRPLDPDHAAELELAIRASLAE